MWAVLKFNKKYVNLLKNDLIKKLGNETKFYLPKSKLQILKKNKLQNKDFYLLGDYMLCNNPKFNNPNILNEIVFCKGLKYFLKIDLYSQNEINDFIEKCKKNEDKEGYIMQTFFSFSKNKDFKFLSGPFASMVFKIVKYNCDKIKILVGKYEAEVSINKYIFNPA